MTCSPHRICSVAIATALCVSLRVDNVVYAADSASTAANGRTSATVLTAGGTEIAPSEEDQFLPILATNGVTVLAVWNEGAFETGRWIGNLRACVIGVSNPITLADQAAASISAAYGNGMYVVVWSAPPRLLAKRVRADGIAIDNEPIVLSSGPSYGASAVAWNGSAFLVVWSALNTLSSAMVQPDGSVSEPRVIDNFPAESVALAWNGERFLLAYEHFDPGLFPCICPVTLRVMSLRENGDRLSIEPADLVTYTWSQSFPQLATSGREFLVTYSEFDTVNAVAVAPDGTPGDAHPLFHWRADLFFAQSIAWNSDHYEVALRYDVPNPGGETASFVGLAAVDRSGIRTGLTTAAAGAHPFQFNNGYGVAIVSTLRGTVIADVEQRGDHSQLVAHDEFELVKAPDPPSAPADPQFFTAGTTIVAAWRDTSDNEEGFVAGNFFRPASVPAGSERTTLPPFAYPPVFIGAWNSGGFSAIVEASSVTLSRRRAAPH